MRESRAVEESQCLVKTEKARELDDYSPRDFE